MDGSDYPEAFAPHRRAEAWPGPLAAGAGLAGMILVWLCALPVAAVAFGTLNLIDRARRALAPSARTEAEGPMAIRRYR